MTAASIPASAAPGEVLNADQPFTPPTTGPVHTEFKRGPGGVGWVPLDDDDLAPGASEAAALPDAEAQLAALDTIGGMDLAPGSGEDAAQAEVDPVTQLANEQEALAALDGIPDALLNDQERALLAAYPSVAERRALAPSAGEQEAADEQECAPGADEAAADPFPRTTEYRRLAAVVLEARDAKAREVDARRKLAAKHAAAMSAQRHAEERTRADQSASEQALGDYVRTTGMGDPEGVLKGTTQRLTTRAVRA